MMKKTIFKKLMVLCTSAALAFGTVPAGAADVVPQAVTVETVSAQAAKPGKNLKDKNLAKSLDKVIKTQKFTKKTTDKQKLQKLFNYTKKLTSIHVIWGFLLQKAGMPSLQRKLWPQRRQVATMMQLPLLILPDAQQDFL